MFKVPECTLLVLQAEFSRFMRSQPELCKSYDKVREDWIGMLDQGKVSAAVTVLKLLLQPYTLCMRDCLCPKPAAHTKEDPPDIADHDMRYSR